MNNFLKIFGLIILLSQNLASQDFGVKLGINNSLSYGDLYYYDYKYQNRLSLGAQLGLYLKYKIANRFYIQPEILASYKTSKITSGTDYQFTTSSGAILQYFKSNTNLFSVDIPVLLGYELTNKFRVKLGCFVSYVFLASQKYPDIKQLSVGSSSIDYSKNNGENLNKLFYGAILSLEYLVTDKIGIGLGNQVNFNQLSKNESNNSVLFLTPKTLHTIAINLNYKL